MFEQPTPLERWASRNPGVRWPIVIVVILLLWVCGGAFDHEPAPQLKPRADACTRAHPSPPEGPLNDCP